MERKHYIIRIISLITILTCILGITDLIVNKNNKNINADEIKYTVVTNKQFKSDLDKNKIDSALINGKNLYFKEGQKYYVVHSYNPSFTNALKLKKLDVNDAVQNSSALPDIVVVLITIVLLIFISIIVFFIVGMVGAAKSIGKNTMGDSGMLGLDMPFGKKQNKIVAEKPNVTFDDVCGCEDLKKSLKNDIACLKNPAILKEMGARMPKGIILYGPPGTGKTLIAKAIAGTAEINFIKANGSDFMEMYVGVGAKRVRDLYAAARKNAPCIVFIDEIDAIAGKRGMSNNSEMDVTINALLNELDGFDGTEGILTICATNRLDVLDEAFIRPGRFDRQLAVPLPDKNDRRAIIMKNVKNKQFDKSVNFDNLVTETPGFSGAELETVINESALNAIAENRKIISNEDIENAYFRLVVKGDKKKDVRSAKTNRIIAYHEAGHAIANSLLTKDNVPKVTIVGSTSGAGGITFRVPKEEGLQTKKYFENQIKCMYAGRAAEYVLSNDSNLITNGASNDIEQATKIIKAYIGKFGMGSAGLIDLSEFKDSDKDIFNEAKSLSEKLYTETVVFLKKHRKALDMTAEALIEKETITGDELSSIIKQSEVKEEV